MDQPQASDDRHPVAAAQPATAPGRPRVSARLRWTLVLGAFVVLAPSSFMAWNWYQWTRTDAYQLRRIEEQAAMLLPELQGMDSHDRWIALLALVDDPREALTRARAIDNPYHRIGAMSRLAATLSRAGLDAEAEETRRELSESARLLLESASTLDVTLQQMETLKAIALALHRAGLTGPSNAAGRRAAAAVRRLPSAEIRALTLGQLAVVFARAGGPDLSGEFVLEIKDPSQQEVALDRVVSALGGAGQIDRAREIALLAGKAMLAARESARPGDDRKLLDWQIGRTAIVMARIGLGQQAHDMVRTIADPTARRTELSYLAPVLMDHGFPTLARSASLESKAAARQVDDPVQRWTLLRSAAVVLARSDAMEEAREAALSARDTLSQIESDPAGQTYRIKETVLALARAGLDGPAADTLRSAAEAARRIDDPLARSTAWTTVVATAAEIHAGNQTKEAARSAEEAARQIPQPAVQTAALGRVVSALSKDVPAEVVTARDLAFRIADPMARHSALATILQACLDAGSIDQARELLQPLEKAAIQVRHPTSQADALASLVLAMIRLDDLDEALRIARIIGMPVQRSTSLAATAKALARKRRFREARAAAEACDRPSDRLEACLSVAVELTRAKKPHLAAALDELAAPETRTGP